MNLRIDLVAKSINLLINLNIKLSQTIRYEIKYIKRPINLEIRRLNLQINLKIERLHFNANNFSLWRLWMQKLVLNESIKSKQIVKSDYLEWSFSTLLPPPFNVFHLSTHLILFLLIQLIMEWWNVRVGVAVQYLLHQHRRNYNRWLLV